MSSFNLILSELAEKELADAYIYYESKSNLLGEKLILEVESILEKIEKNPHLFPRRYKHYREAVLKKFPYLLVYEILEKQIVIHSVFNTHRNPAKKL